MRMIVKKAIPRRTMLRGFGASLAMPLLDGMVPALTAIEKTAAKPVRRLGVVYLPNGMSMGLWTPKTEGSAFELSPILQPLAPFRDRLLVLTGLNNKEANAKAGEGAGDHTRGPATFLTGTHIKKTEGADIHNGMSMDQIAARHLGEDTQLASLELAIESNELLGACDVGYSCAYQTTLAWKTPTTPLPMENDPRAVFERLFGTSDSTDRGVRAADQARNRSLLDSVSQAVARINKDLGPHDRAKLGSYLDAVRDVERRIQKAETQNSRELPVVEQPSKGIPATFEEHARLMFDLLVLAYQSDLTRVFTFMVAREFSPRTYPESGVPDAHHPLSHHGDEPEKLQRLARLNAYHINTFAYLLQKMRATSDGDGSLLDHTLIMCGGGLSDSNKHTHDNLPVLLVGGDSDQVRGGRHLRFSSDTPLANLHLSVLNAVGVPTEQLGDSTGKLDLLSGSRATV